MAHTGANPTGIDTLGLLLEGEGYRLTYASGFKHPLWRLLHMMFRTAFVRKVDFVLIDTYSTTNFWYAYWVSQLCRLRKLKYVPILHGGNLPKRWQTHPKSCQRIFYKAYCNVSPSAYLKEIFAKKGCPNLVVIPNPIEIQQYNFKERSTIQPKLLWVRAFAEIYNPLMAIRVLAQLVQDYPEASLCMVGPDKDGSLEKAKALAKNLKVNVRFTGQLSKKEWVRLASEYDFFLNTTHFDNLPVSVIEAMSLGLAVISTRVGGIPFLIEDNQEGILVGDNELEEMGKAIQFLLKNPSKHLEITKKARNKADLFQWEQLKEKWAVIFNSSVYDF